MGASSSLSGQNGQLDELQVEREILFKKKIIKLGKCGFNGCICTHMIPISTSNTQTQPHTDATLSSLKKKHKHTQMLDILRRKKNIIKYIYKLFLVFTVYTLRLTHIVYHMLISGRFLVLAYKLVKKEVGALCPPQNMRVPLTYYHDSLS